jgi:hypothetical protein
MGLLTKRKKPYAKLITQLAKYNQQNGKAKPPLALVKLFKLLDRHPDLLNEVRT